MSSCPDTDIDSHRITLQLLNQTARLRELRKILKKNLNWKNPFFLSIAEITYKIV